MVGVAIGPRSIVLENAIGEPFPIGSNRGVTPIRI
ncbi:hypothetical protein J2X47_000437 [Sphingomonas sp. BE270]|jgi:hypothetical protein|nr:hypothetical protein [Sphingomonas sp. BE270]